MSTVLQFPAPPVNPHERAHRKNRALKLAALLGTQYSAATVRGFNEEQWKLAAEGARVNYPVSQLTQALVVQMIEAHAVTEHLKSIGWRLEVNYGGEVSYIRPDSEYCVEMNDGWWTIGRFTDSDIDGVARGRYQGIEEGQTVQELRMALLDVEAVEVGKGCA